VNGRILMSSGENPRMNNIETTAGRAQSLGIEPPILERLLG
jgi:hypothetical protein